MTGVLVTGAAGALGRRVVELLNSRGGYRVVCAARDGDSRPNWVRCDVRDSSQVAEAIDRAAPDFILHLAATFSGDIDEMYSANVQPARSILEHVCRRQRKSKIVLTGSAAEYGVVRSGENPVREDRVLAPVSAYGVSKAWQTQLLGHYAGRGVDVVCARIFNLLGEGVSDRLFAGRLRQQIGELKAGSRSVIEMGPLSAIRDYVSTEEAAAQVLAIMEHGTTGGIYHVASGVPVRVRDLVLRELSLQGLDPSIVRESSEFSNRVGYDVPVIYADMIKTRRLIEEARGDA